MSRESNDSARLSALLVIFPRDPSGASHAAKESRRPHSSADLEVTEIVGEIKESVLELDTGNVLANVDAIARRPFDPSHSVNPFSPNTAERFEIGAGFLNESNLRLSITLVIGVPLLPTDLSLRQTAESFRHGTTETLSAFRNVSRPTLAAAA